MQSAPFSKTQLRFITCGSVDDGKSTLIGRLLNDAGAVLEDQLRAASNAQGDVDFAALLDGLDAEREQGITIDVAYRYFQTPARSFVVADCPGHEQYTRNMATGASTAQAAIVLVDARKGVLTQTRRHTWICGLFGVRDVILAVNKMDLVGYDQSVFEAICHAYTTIADAAGISTVTAIPVSALRGENLVARSSAMTWYSGPTLIETLESIEPAQANSSEKPFHLPIQYVNRAGQDFRGYCGTVASGSVRAGETVVVQPSNLRATITSVLCGFDSVAEAAAGDAVTVTLDRDIDISRGNVLSVATAPLEVSDQFSTHLLWLSSNSMLPGRSYRLLCGTREVMATITEVKHLIDVDTQAELAAKQLEVNQVGACNISLTAPIPFAKFDDSHVLGGFILIDRQTNETVAAGRIEFALRRANNIHWQAIEVDRRARANSLGQNPKCVWFTGLSGSGKSTIANAVEKQLMARGKHAYILDGDNVRHGLNKDLGFTDVDRVENIRRVAEVAKLMTDAGLIVLVSFISPFRSERRMARELFESGEFIEVHVDTSLEVAESRDVKGLYAKARAGEIPNFTGIDSPYEAPESPELRLNTVDASVEDCAEKIIHALGL